MIWQSNVSRFGRAGGFCWVIQSTSSSTAWRAMSARCSCVFVRGWGHVGGEGHVVKAENRQIAAYGQARFGGGEIDALCGAVTKAEHGSGRIRHRPQRHTRSSGPESALRSAFARWAAWPFRVNPRERVALCTHAIQHQTKGVFGGGRSLDGTLLYGRNSLLTGKRTGICVGFGLSKSAWDAHIHELTDA